MLPLLIQLSSQDVYSYLQAHSYIFLSTNPPPPPQFSSLCVCVCLWCALTSQGPISFIILNCDHVLDMRVNYNPVNEMAGGVFFSMAALLLSRSAGYLAVHNTLQLKSLTLMCHCISTLTLSDQERTGEQHRLTAAHNWDRESSYKGATVQSNTIHLSVPVSFTAKYVQNMKSNVNRVAFKVSLHNVNPRQKYKLHIHFQLSLKISYSSIKHTNYK